MREGEEGLTGPALLRKRRVVCFDDDPEGKFYLACRQQASLDTTLHCCNPRAFSSGQRLTASYFAISPDALTRYPKLKESLENRGVSEWGKAKAAIAAFNKAKPKPG